MTSLKVYPNISEEDQIHYFHSLLRDEALQTNRNMIDTNRASLEDIIATFRRRNVRPQSIATTRFKWEQLYFDPSRQTFEDFLEQHQKLAQEAYCEDAPSIHRNNLLCQNADLLETSPQPSQVGNRIL